LTGFGTKHATELARAEARSFGKQVDRQWLMKIASRKNQRILHAIGLRVEFQQSRMLRLTASAAMVKHQHLGDVAGRFGADVSLDHPKCEIDAGRHSRRSPNRAIGNEDPVRLHFDFRKAVLQVTGIKPMSCRTTTVEKAGFGERERRNTDRRNSPR
jgi:hypothetical protein